MTTPPTPTDSRRDVALLAYPMHGHRKLTMEGYRTRDGHFIEWFGRHFADVGTVQVHSRPEPAGFDRLKSMRPGRRAPAPPNVGFVDSSVFRLPNMRDRFRWWSDSAAHYPQSTVDPHTPAIMWNPFMAVSSVSGQLFTPERTTVFDLLDDWTIHYAFEGVRDAVDNAYRTLFDCVTHVTANAEGTLELAHRFGRTDAVLLPNGCDPERFSTESTASGPLRVGYIGKLGRRINDQLIVAACEALPEIEFLIAGPILDGDIDKKLARFSNCTLVGDIHYDDVPALMQTFDIGWVPHHVGEGEVGGDVIKTYEYRAAGLPVLSTPISGIRSRGLEAVTVLDASDHVAWLAAKLAEHSERVPRAATPFPEDATWKRKSAALHGLLTDNNG